MHPHLTRFSADLWGPLSASAGFLLFIFSEHDALVVLMWLADSVIQVAYCC